MLFFATCPKSTTAPPARKRAPPQASLSVPVAVPV
jgi:hypothetical protein